MEETCGMATMPPQLLAQLVAMRDALVRTTVLLTEWQHAADRNAHELVRESRSDILQRHDVPAWLQRI